MQLRPEKDATRQAMTKKMREREIKAVIMDFLRNTMGLK
jgi:hypothetical protein